MFYIIKRALKAVFVLGVGFWFLSTILQLSLKATVIILFIALILF